jgi:DNA-binding transcriptional ArsR family regulator
MQMPALSVIDDAAHAATALHPKRREILALLREPGSASTVARRLGWPRQKVNYHLRELEKAGFLEQVEERRTGNCVERIVRARATHFLVHPELLGLGSDPETVADRFSSTYLIAVAAEAIREVAAAQQKAAAAHKRLATFSMRADVRFANAADRQAFTEQLANAVAKLVAKFNDDHAAGGRSFRFVVGAYPSKRKEETTMARTR